MEINQIDSSSLLTFSEAGTPIPQKQKKPVEMQKNDLPNFKKEKPSGPAPGHSFAAKPQARPITSWGQTGNSRQPLGAQQPVSKEQQEILQDIMKGNAKAIAQRPQTAATSSLKDEQRILDKLKYLEKIEQRIEQDLEEFVVRRGDKKKAKKKGVAVMKQMLLDASQ